MNARNMIANRVSRETLERLDVYVGCLRRWNTTINLVSAATIGDVWRRHVLDSAQFAWSAPETPREWADIGAGAGLPGLIVAACFSETAPGTRFTLVEKDERKSAFLSEAARRMGLEPAIVTTRLGTEAAPAASALRHRFDVVSARALAPLDALLALAAPLMAPDAVGLFAKGRSAAGEIAEAGLRWRMNVVSIPSVTEPGSVLLRIGGLRRA